MKYLFRYYKGYFAVIMLCIVITAAAGVSSSVFLEILVDEVIAPGITQGFGAVSAMLTKIILVMGGIYVLGVIASFFYTRLMAVVTMNFLTKIRTDMFSKMQSLPLRYFDTNTHGDIMSCYTNDTDSLLQLVSQSLPNIFFPLYPSSIC